MWLCELRNTRAGGNSIRCCNAALVGRDLVLSNSFQGEKENRGKSFISILSAAESKRPTAPEPLNNAP